MSVLTLSHLADHQLRGRRVLVRVDFNVPLDESGRVADDTRIRATLPTLERLIGAGARSILLSHLGRPKGEPAPEFSLEPVAARLGEVLPTRVRFVSDTIGDAARAAVAELGDGEALLLENTRFLPGEEKNDADLSRALAELAEVYVNDAFGAAHRAHASTAGVAEVMRATGRIAVAGLLLERELAYLGGALERPRRPFVAVLGGAKISGKIDVIQALLPKTDRLLIGGAMANTFFSAMGLRTGTSLVEEERIGLARELLEQAPQTLRLPDDLRVARKAEAGQETRVVPRQDIPADWMALDVGPQTIDEFAREIGEAATVLWNGPLGMFEIAEFAAGTAGVARAIVAATENGATTIVGGGDSAAALAALGLSDRVSHVSTGGGASLEFLEGRTLPGVAALSPRSVQEATR